MAEDQLDDAEFWLPSHFLTDDDILMDFSPSTNNGSFGFGSGSGSGSDIDLPSNGSETDEDDLLSRLSTPQISSSVILPHNCSPLSKGWNLSTSPQSTLYGYVGKEEGSSHDSPNGPVSPPPSNHKEGGSTTLDLLSKAAGEVARFKMTNDKTTTTTTTTTTTSTSRAGTGFFDCSNKKQFRPPPPPPISTPSHHLPFFSPLHFPPLSHVQQQISMRQQHMISSQVNTITRNKSNEENNKNRPWTPLKAQNQPIQRGPHMFMGQPGPVSKRECVGTGVFLPRRVDAPVETRKKPEGGNTTKAPNGKSSNKGPNSQHQRSGSRQSASKSTDIRLPPEWIY